MSISAKCECDRERDRDRFPDTAGKPETSDGSPIDAMKMIPRRESMMIWPTFCRDLRSMWNRERRATYNLTATIAQGGGNYSSCSWMFYTLDEDKVECWR